MQTFPAYEPIGVVHLTVSEEVGYTAGTTGRSIEMQCPFGTQAMANSILAALSGYVYQPLTITTAYEADPLWELGDTITFNGYTSVIADTTQDFGLAYTADISAPNGEELNHEYEFVPKERQEITKSIAKASASFKVGLDSIEAIVSGIAKPYQEGTQYNRYAVVYKGGKYYQCNVSRSSTTWVSSEWTEQSSGALSSIIKQTMDSITLSAVSGENHSTITLSANGIVVDSQVVEFSKIVADSIVANASISAPSIFGGTLYDLDRDVSLSFDKSGAIRSLVFRDVSSSRALLSFDAGIIGDTIISELAMAGYKVISAGDVIEGAALSNIISIDTSDGTLKIRTTNGRYWTISGNGVKYYDSDGSLVNYCLLAH